MDRRLLPSPWKRSPKPQILQGRLAQWINHLDVEELQEIRIGSVYFPDAVFAHEQHCPIGKIFLSLWAESARIGQLATALECLALMNGAVSSACDENEYSFFKGGRE
jgi:hypothetical protein